MSEKENEKKITIHVIVMGDEQEYDVNVKKKLEPIVKKALKDSGNEGQPISKWQLRTEDGRLLDMDKTIEEEHILDGDKLFLSLKQGKGGILSLY